MADEESTTQEETFEVDGKQVTREELLNGYKFAQANHERAEAIKRERETVEADRKRLAEERTAWLNERNAQAQVNQTVVETLRGFAPKEKAPDDSPYPVLERIKSIDMLGDTAAGEKLATEIQAALDDRERRVSEREATKRRQELDELKRSFSQQLATETEKVRTQLVLENAREKATRANDETFQRTLKEKFGDVEFNSKELADVRKHFQAQVSSEFGVFDSNGQWRYKPEAVDRAVWASPEGRRVMLARENANARRDGMIGRVRGESATASTPSRSTRQTGGGDEALIAKVEQYNRGLAAGIYTPNQVLGAFSEAEMSRYNELRAGARQAIREAG